MNYCDLHGMLIDCKGLYKMKLGHYKLSIILGIVIGIIVGIFGFVYVSTFGFIPDISKSSMMILLAIGLIPSIIVVLHSHLLSKRYHSAWKEIEPMMGCLLLLLVAYWIFASSFSVFFSEYIILGIHRSTIELPLYFIDGPFITTHYFLFMLFLGFAYISPIYLSVPLMTALVAAHFATKGVDGREKRIKLMVILTLAMYYVSVAPWVGVIRLT